RSHIQTPAPIRRHGDAGISLRTGKRRTGSQGLFDNAGRRRLLKGLGDKLARHARCFRQVYRSIGSISQVKILQPSLERTTMPSAIKVTGLVKHYGSLVAVNNISFDVKEGEI